MAGDFERVFRALEAAKVRYLVVGGVAVVLHGHLRFTADLDLVVQLEETNVRNAITALQALGFNPRAPVDPMELADATTRRSWIRDKGLTVFSLWSVEMPGTEVDLFVEEPFDFDDADTRAISADLGGIVVRVVGRDDLIAMKRAVGRPKDLEDAAVLTSLSEHDE